MAHDDQANWQICFATRSDTPPLLACAVGGIVLAIAVTRDDEAMTASRVMRIWLDPGRRDLARWRCSPHTRRGHARQHLEPRPLQGLFDGLQNAASLRVGFRTTPTDGVEISTLSGFGILQQYDELAPLVSLTDFASSGR